MSTFVDPALLLVPIDTTSNGREPCGAGDDTPEDYACTRWFHPDNPLHAAHAFDALIPVRAWVDGPSELAVADFKDRESLIDLGFLLEPAPVTISCAAVAPSRVPYLCTRAKHHNDGVHIAASTIGIHAVWVTA